MNKLQFLVRQGEEVEILSSHPLRGGRRETIMLDRPLDSRREQALQSVLKQLFAILDRDDENLEKVEEKESFWGPTDNSEELLEIISGLSKL